jgi:twitching motility protein PilT
MTLALTRLIETALHWAPSDIHLYSGDRPRVRVNGELRELDESCLVEEDLRRMLAAVVSEKVLDEVLCGREYDCAVELVGRRFRLHAYRAHRGVAAVLRVLPDRVPDLDHLMLPPVVAEIALEPRGLVLVTGPVGTGKSSTLAGIIHYINSHRRSHIVTLEDPIEIVHTPLQSLITQREVGSCTTSWFNGLRASLRQDPDVLMVGELRDPETMQLALTAAETGHLVLSTLHTSGASQAITRVMDLFPSAGKDRVRGMLADSLTAVIGQRLVTRSGGGRIPNVEVLRATAAIRNLIREGKTHQIPGAIQTSGHHGMFTFEQHYTALMREGAVPRTHNHSHGLGNTPS